MEDNVNDLRGALEALAAKVTALEARVAELENAQEIPEEDLIAIGAAVAAYFGHKAKVKAIRYGTQSRWAAATRERLHNRSVPHVR
ncbi:hypothetical protein [Tessaracoccus defluvii]|uniref:hypothetical protein n=1 Tax=Tessaracoccus defluvii TaxID=1285901 RepID=UPI0031DEDCC1